MVLRGGPGVALRSTPGFTLSPAIAGCLCVHGLHKKFNEAVRQAVSEAEAVAKQLSATVAMHLANHEGRSTK
jgi:hypothetical protein